MRLGFLDFKRWITAAPISERSAKEFRRDVKRLRDGVRDFHPPVTPRKKGSPPPPTPDPTSVWAENYDTTEMLIGGKNLLLPDTGVFLTYRFLGRPVGVMVLKDQGPGHGIPATCVKLIVTHPGVAQAGGSMLEYAFYYARKHGWPQVLHLKPTITAREAYKKLGFRPLVVGGQDTEYMILDPADAGDKWGRVGKDWRLAALVDEGYVIDA
jgi:hypothetical protein